MDFIHKLVAVINKDLDTGIALNALGHMTIGLGFSLQKDVLRLDDYCDANGNIYPNISQVLIRGMRVSSTLDIIPLLSHLFMDKLLNCC